MGQWILPSMKRLVSLCLVLACALTACGSSGGATSVTPRDEAVHRAQALYRKHRSAGEDLSRGPCISNGTDIPGWVVDIAHRPRQPVDNDPKYQCSAYIQGKVQHFVELDPNGRLIRTGP